MSVEVYSCKIHVEETEYLSCDVYKDGNSELILM